jgi:hypothetical protein
LQEAQRRIEVYERQARLEATKQASLGDRSAVRVQMRRDRRMAQGRSGGGGSGRSNGGVVAAAHRHFHRESTATAIAGAEENAAEEAGDDDEEAWKCVGEVCGLLRVDRPAAVVPAIRRILDAFEALVEVRTFMDRVCHAVVPDQPGNLELMLSTLMAWKESFLTEVRAARNRDRH